MKFTIRKKLVFGFSGVMVLMASVAAIGTFAVFRLRQSAYDATRIGARLNAVALEIQIHNLEAERRVRKYLTQSKTDGGQQEGYLEEARFELHEIQSLVTQAVGIAPTPQMRKKFEKIVQASNDYESAIGVAVAAAKAGGPEAEAAEAAYEDAADALHESAEDGELVGRAVSHSSLDSIDRTSHQSIVSVIGISLVGLILGIFASYKLARAILVPVEHLKGVAENVSLGNLDIEVHRYSDDEIGDLADSFSRMVTAVKFFRMVAEPSPDEAAPEGGER
jgi:methyl-accepting chemotaxis protein